MRNLTKPSGKINRLLNLLLSLVLILSAFCFVSDANINSSKVDAKMSLSSKFYVISDFYDRNWKRNFWDMAPDGIAAESGSVTYSNRADKMTVTYTGNYERKEVSEGDRNKMWGADYQIPIDERNFSQSTYYAVEIKNERSTPAKFQLILSEIDTNATDGKFGNRFPDDNDNFFLVDKSQNATEAVTQNRFFTIPANFEGIVLIPFNVYSTLKSTTYITRFSFAFPFGEQGCLTFGRCGHVNNSNILAGANLEYVDNSQYYDIPAKIELISPPVRDITEPVSSKDNNTK